MFALLVGRSYSFWLFFIADASPCDRLGAWCFVDNEKLFFVAPAPVPLNSSEV